MWIYRQRFAVIITSQMWIYRGGVFRVLSILEIYAHHRVGTVGGGEFGEDVT